MPYVTAADGARIHYKDWGAGRPVVLAHGWPLNADSWEGQQLFLAEHGFRAIAHDRRGHGRSTQTWHGNDMDTYADDLAVLMDTLDLTRYIGRHGTARVAQLVLVSAVPPFMLRTDDNPDGVPIEVFDGIRAGSLADRSQLYKDLADGPFFGNNRHGDIRPRACGTPSGSKVCRPGTATPTMHRRVLRDRLPRGPRHSSTCRRCHPRRRRPGRSVRGRRRRSRPNASPAPS